VLIYEYYSFFSQKPVRMQDQQQVYRCWEASYQADNKTLSHLNPAHTAATGNPDSCLCLPGKSSLAVRFTIKEGNCLEGLQKQLHELYTKMADPQKSIKAQQTFSLISLAFQFSLCLFSNFNTIYNLTMTQWES